MAEQKAKESSEKLMGLFYTNQKQNYGSFK